jgi:hypothetical protein
VYSITDDTSFSKLERLRDEIIRAQAGRPVPIFLVGTKADLAADRAVVPFAPPPVGAPTPRPYDDEKAGTAAAAAGVSAEAGKDEAGAGPVLTPA